MAVNLKIDPRKARKFIDYGVQSAVLDRLGFISPLPIQAKMLALNASGISAYATSVPSQGKTTAAILGLLSTPRQSKPLITNLVLVPTPGLADQYIDQLGHLSGSPNSYKRLYRTGSVDSDEQQHSSLLEGLNSHTITSLVATPQRLLDYISADPSLVPIQSLRQIVVDEFDVFGATNPLETLLVYLLQHPKQKDAVLTFIGTDIAQKNFKQLPQLLPQMNRPMYEVKEPEPEWDGEMISHEDVAVHDVSACAKRIKQTWTGPGLVITPAEISASQLQTRLDDLEGAVVVHAPEVAGLNIEKLENIYVLNGEHYNATDITRFKWMLSGEHKKMHIIS